MIPATAQSQHSALALDPWLLLAAAGHGCWDAAIAGACLDVASEHGCRICLP